MKKNLFSKFAALFLAGAMLTGVGCKDYDGDIDDINKRLDGLESTVALKTDLTSINSSIKALEAIDHGAFLKTSDFATTLDNALKGYNFAVKGDLDKYLTQDDIKNFLTSDQIKDLIKNAGHQNEEQVKALIKSMVSELKLMNQSQVEEMISGKMTEEQVKALIAELKLQDTAGVEEIFTRMIEAFDLYGAVKSDVVAEIGTEFTKFMKTYQLSDAQIAQVKTAIFTDFSTAIAEEMGKESNAYRTSIEKWLGDDFATYMQAYVTDGSFGTSMNSQLVAANSALETSIKALISAAIVENNKLYITKADLEDKFEAYDKKIQALADRIFELEGRIQSMVWVPNTANDFNGMQLTFESLPTIKQTGTDKIYYISEDGVSATGSYNATATLRVTPASAVAYFENPNYETTFTLFNEHLTRAVTNMEVELVSVDKAAGKFTVAIKCADDLTAANAGKQTIMALNVKVEKKAAAEEPEVMSEGETAVANQGIDYTTSYITVNAGSQKTINDNIVLGKLVGDEFIAVNTTLQSSIEYTYEGAYEFMKDIVYYYYDAEANSYTKLDEAFPALDTYRGIPAETKKATVANVSADLFTLKNTSFTITPATRVQTIDGVVTSDQYAYGVTARASSVDFFEEKVQEAVTILTKNTDYNATAASYMWTYAQATNSNTYVANGLQINGMTAKLYNEFKSAQAPSIVAKVYDAKNAEVGSLTAALALTATPTADTDVMLGNLTITGDLAKTANYTAKITYEHLNRTTETIVIPFSVTGMPTLAGIEITKQAIAFTGVGKTYELAKNFADLIAEKNTAVYGTGKAFASKTELTDAIYGGALTATKNGKATLAEGTGTPYAATTLVATFDTDAAFGATYKPTAEIELISGTDLKVTITTMLALVKPDNGLIQNAQYFIDGVALAYTELDGTTFRVIDKDITALYSKADPLSPAKIVYTITQDLKDFVGAKPALDQNYKLSWNEWNSFTLEMAVDLQIDGKSIIDAPLPFIVKIEDPVAADITNIKTVDAEILVKENGDVNDQKFKLAKKMSLKTVLKDKTGNAVVEIFDATATDGLAAAPKAALVGKVTYELVLAAGQTMAEGVSFDTNTGTLSYNKVSSIALVNPLTYTVKATYTYLNNGKEHVRSFSTAVTIKGDK